MIVKDGFVEERAGLRKEIFPGDIGLYKDSTPKPNSMMFCPKCGKLMKFKDGRLMCAKCGYVKEISSVGKEQLKKVAYMRENDILIVDEDLEIETKPTCATKCPNCGHGVAEWWLRQLRSADESEVRFFRCTKCKHTWREYD